MAGSGEFRVGQVIRETFRIARLNFWGFFLVALVTVEVPKWGGPVLLAPAIATFQRAAIAGQDFPALSFLHGVALGAAPSLVAQLGLILVTGMVVRAATDDFAGRAASFGPCLRTGLATFAGNLALTVLYYLCFLLGLVLLVVPGLTLSCMWVVILPVYVAERGPVLSAFGRSRALTKDCRWRIFGLTLLYGLLVGGGLGFLSGLAKGLASKGVPSGIVLSVQVVAALLGGAIAVVSAAGVTAIYIKLRQAKEGTLSADLVEAFA